MSSVGNVVDDIVSAEWKIDVGSLNSLGQELTDLILNQKGSSGSTLVEQPGADVCAP